MTDRLHQLPLAAPDQWDEVIRAREAAHAKHGENSIERLPWESDQWLRVLMEEVGEVARATTYDNGSREDLRAELVDVLAVASAWLSAVDAAKYDEGWR